MKYCMLNLTVAACALSIGHYGNLTMPGWEWADLLRFENSTLQDMQTPELKVAIKSAQRLAERMVGGGPPNGLSPPWTPAGLGA